ncbi:hypothetical protein AB1Y20_002556 [Prymnesium parvum]|uniref:Uncharacterized protein n=1 Tax=Prymnesium parvum TaxID=97485 RepID=A0AB34JC54_PRYPA
MFGRVADLVLLAAAFWHVPCCASTEPKQRNANFDSRTRGATVQSGSQSDCDLLDRILVAVHTKRGCSDKALVNRSLFARFQGERWTNPTEACLLFLLAKLSSGPIAEQGPFLGASTIVMAAGLRDSEAPNRLFTSTDIFSISPSKHERYQLYPFYNTKRQSENSTTLSDLVVDDEVVFTRTMKDYAKTWGKGNRDEDGQLPPLMSNLHAAGINNYVSVTIGSRIPTGIAYGVIWTDATHNYGEIKKNVPALIETARLSSCATLAFHDVNPHPGAKSPQQLMAPTMMGEGSWLSNTKLLAEDENSERLHGRYAAAIEKLIQEHDCRVLNRVGAGVIYSVTVECNWAH